MAKVSGITTAVSIDTSGNALTDISNDVTSITLNTSRGVKEITGIDKAAVERILLRADGTGDIKGIFNQTLSHTVFSDVPTSNYARDMVIAYPGATMTMIVLLSDYALDLGDDGSLMWSVPFALQSGTVPAWT